MTGLHMVNSREVETTVTLKLCDNGSAELRQIVCQYDQIVRTLTLRGRVSSFYLKQIAQELAREIEYVEQIINLIEVREK